MYQSPNDLRSDDATIREAIRFATLVVVAGVGFLIIAFMWVSTCDGSTVDTAACGPPQRTLLALGAPVILLAGGVYAFRRTYRNWRTNRTWVAWQGAGWFLLSLMLIVLMLSLAPLLGPTT